MSQMESTGQSSGTSMVEQAQQKIQDGAGEAKGAVRERITGQIDQRSNEIGRELRHVAEAFRQTGTGLESQGDGTSARVVNGVSDRAERIGSYLSQSTSDRILHDVEHFGRRNPWLVIGGGMLLGIAASRLLKASSTRRFDTLQGSGYSSRRPESQWQPHGATMNPGP